MVCHQQCHVHHPRVRQQQEGQQQLKPSQGRDPVGEISLLRGSCPLNHTAPLRTSTNFLQEKIRSQLDPAITAVRVESQFLLLLYSSSTSPADTFPEGHPSLGCTLGTVSAHHSFQPTTTHHRISAAWFTQVQLGTHRSYLILLLLNCRETEIFMFFSYLCSTNWDHRLPLLGRAWEERRWEVNRNIDGSGGGCSFNPVTQSWQTEKLQCIKLWRVYKSWTSKI